MLTLQLKVHQVHKSTRYLHLSHTTFSMFIYPLNNIYPQQFIHKFILAHKDTSVTTLFTHFSNLSLTLDSSAQGPK